MANATAQIGYVNLLDTATLTASSQVLLTPVTRLQDPHIGVKWQGNSGAESITVDLGSVKTIDCARLMGVTADTVRVRYSTTNPADGDVCDTGPITVDHAFQTVTDIRSVNARYVRWDLVCATANCEAGRGFVGPLETFGINFSWNWNRKWVDPSDRKKTEGGQTRINRRQRYRVFAVTFECLSDVEANGFTDDIDRVNGMTDDVLFIPIPGSARVEQDSIWGLMTDLSPVAQQFLDRWSKPLSIEQRI